MKIKPLFSKIIFSSVVFGLACASVSSQEKFDVKNTQAILISVAMTEIHDAPPKGDEALLITDKNEIVEFVKLFDGKSKSFTHACGYHWRITFVRKSSEPIDVWLNQNCEEFEKNTKEIREKIQSKSREIKTNPTYFITEIGIDAKLSPEEAISKITEKPNLSVFVPGDLDKRFPYIEIESTAVSDIPEDKKLWNKATEETQKKADMLLTSESKRLGQNYAILKNGEFERSISMFGGGKIEERRKMKVYFQIGMNLENIERNLTNTKLLEKEEPKVYFLQLVSKDRFSQEFINGLSNEFPFIKQGFAYNSYPR